MKNTIEEIKITTDSSPMKGEVHTHPAFAMIAAHRITGSIPLYGSDFNHQHFMGITISKGSMRRSLSNDWYSSENELIEVYLSEAQWATFVSATNTIGVPCTLQRFNRNLTPQLPPPIKRIDQFKQESMKTMQEALTRIERLEQQIKETSLSKKSSAELLSSADSIRQSLAGSLPYVLTQFDKHMETTVEKAKIEINAYATHTIMQAGLDTIQGKQMPVLTFGADDNG